ncbi:hypothetical protein A3Q56_00867 [Intoshia linei]|uniref:PCI domain-containing protein n=1 Tax=Intoshia linei TaxID=1819745 RepID=A0A177BAL6_9BILA|nr:hypothetical protein A3Q56_00867 [Intoshia linei]
MSHFLHLKHESIYNRACELIEIGDKDRALNLLYDCFRVKKYRLWNKTMESMADLTLSLCVEMRKSLYAKQTLHQYRYLSQNASFFIISTNTFDNVAIKFLKLCEDRVHNLHNSFLKKINAQSANDIECIETPESLLSSYDDSQKLTERSCRDNYMPWAKFLWEAYRNVLENIKNNKHYENLYCEICVRSLKYCLKYGRKTDFKKLIDYFRNHLKYIRKAVIKPYSVNMNIPDTQQLFIEIRKEMVNTSLQMHLFQDAFKSLEELNSIIISMRTIPKASLLSSYFKSLSIIFWQSEHYLYYAATIKKLYQLYCEKRKSPTRNEVTRLSVLLTCSALIIPLIEQDICVDQSLTSEELRVAKSEKLSGLLISGGIPTRESIKKYIDRLNILDNVPICLKNTYYALELSNKPLKMLDNVSETLEYFEKNNDVKKFLEPLIEVICIRLILQLSNLYEVFSFSKLFKLLPKTVDKFYLERIIIIMNRSKYVPIRINHQDDTIIFNPSKSCDNSIDYKYCSNVKESAVYQAVANMSIQSEKIKDILIDLKSKTDDNWMHEWHNYRIDSENNNYSERLELLKKTFEDTTKTTLTNKCTVKIKTSTVDTSLQNKIKQMTSNLTKSEKKVTFDEPIVEPVISVLDAALSKKRKIMQSIILMDKKVSYATKAKYNVDIKIYMEVMEAQKEAYKLVWDQTEKKIMNNYEKLLAERNTIVARLVRMRGQGNQFFERVLNDRRPLFTINLEKYNKAMYLEKANYLEKCKAEFVKRKIDEAERKEELRIKKEKLEQQEKERIEMEIRTNKLDLAALKRRQFEEECQRKYNDKIQNVTKAMSRPDTYMGRKSVDYNSPYKYTSRKSENFSNNHNFSRGYSSQIKDTNQNGTANNPTSENNAWLQKSSSKKKK